MDDELRQIPLLRTLPRQALQRIADTCEVWRFQKGQTVFEEGRPAEAVWIVRQGWIYLTKRTPQGGLVTIFVMTPNEALCGISAFDRGTYSATATAATEAQVLQVPAAVFAKLLAQHPKFAQQVLAVCCLRIRHMAETISLASMPVEQRLAHALLRLHAHFGTTVRITHQELARMAGTRLETSIRTVAGLKRRCWLATSRGQLTILQPEQLQNLVTPPRNGHRDTNQPAIERKVTNIIDVPRAED